MAFQFRPVFFVVAGLHIPAFLKNIASKKVNIY